MGGIDFLCTNRHVELRTAGEVNSEREPTNDDGKNSDGDDDTADDVPVTAFTDDVKGAGTGVETCKEGVTLLCRVVRNTVGLIELFGVDVDRSKILCHVSSPLQP